MATESRSDRRRRERLEHREFRRLALQSTAEMCRGLDIIEAEIEHGLYDDALSTIQLVRELVVLADKTMVEAMRNKTTQETRT